MLCPDIYVGGKDQYQNLGFSQNNTDRLAKADLLEVSLLHVLKDVAIH